MRSVILLTASLVTIPTQLIASGLPHSVSAESYLPGTKVAALDAERDDYFGSSVGADGSYIVVGTPYDADGTTLGPGSAYVFRREGNEWIQIIKLVPPDGVSFDTFGESVAIDAGLVAIGAPERDSGRGSAYLFRETGSSWVFEAKIEASDREPGAHFGASISVRGDDVLVGAPGRQGGRGAAYVFRRSSHLWHEEQRLTPTSIAANDNFGRSVSLDRGTALVGAPLRDESFTNQGAAYVFVRNNTSWSQRAKLLRVGAASSDLFGQSVAIDAGRAAVGAPLADSNALENAGAVEVFDAAGETWTRTAKLTATIPSSNAQFGYSVALRGAKVLVGLASETVSGAFLRGSLQSFTFQNGDWSASAQLLGEPGRAGDQLGFSVALSEDFAVGGAPGASFGDLSYSGAIHAFIQLNTETRIAPIAGAPLHIGSTYAVQSTVSTSDGAGSGNVQVGDDVGNTCTAPLVAGTSTCSLSASAVGLRQITARYEGGPGLAESSASTTVQIQPDLRIGPAALADAQIGRPYSTAFGTAGTGATLPLAYDIASGSLPAGLSLGASGSLSGTPSEFGSFNFSVRVTDSSGASLGGPFSETRSYSLRVQPPFTTSMALLAPTTTGDRGETLAVASQLEVIESGAAAPVGTYVVTATNGTRVISCSSKVSAEGVQSCGLVFATSEPVGDYSIVARFQSSNADYADSAANGGHRLFAAADPAASIEALDPTWTEGQNLRFALTVQNSGPDAALGLRVQFDVDVALEGLAWTCAGAACPAANGQGAVDFTLPSLPVGASLQLQLAGSAIDLPPSAISANASLSFDSVGFGRDIDSGNNSATTSSLPLKIFDDGFEQPRD